MLELTKSERKPRQAAALDYECLLPSVALTKRIIPSLSLTQQTAGRREIYTKCYFKANLLDVTLMRDTKLLALHDSSKSFRAKVRRQRSSGAGSIADNTTKREHFTADPRYVRAVDTKTLITASYWLGSTWPRQGPPGKSGSQLPFLELFYLSSTPRVRLLTLAIPRVCSPTDHQT